MKTEVTPADEIMSAWQTGAQFAEVDGVRVHYRVEGDGPWLVCFHGFPTSAWDWHQLVPLLAPHRRVLVFDFPGHGLSAKPTDRDYSLLRQCDAAEALLRSLGIVRCDLLAHDMGNSVACELLYRIEQRETHLELRSLTLLNGGLYMELHRPLLTQRLLRLPVVGALVARLTSWMLFRRQYPKVYARPEQFAEAHYRHQWNLLLHGGGRRTLALIAGYMRERVRRGERWLGPLHRTTLPLAVIWGREDPIAVHAIAERLVRENPRARLVTLEGVGHYPQLEAPAWVASQVLPALAAAEGT